MLLIAAAALSASSPPPRPAGPIAEAIATVRILTAVQLKLDGSANAGMPPVRVSQLRSADGTTQQAKLIEFQ